MMMLTNVPGASVSDVGLPGLRGGRWIALIAKNDSGFALLKVGSNVSVASG